jgi:hypothetical protein
MALPGSGVLTLDDIQTEFGGTNPIDLSDYYRAGGLVPDSALNAAIPTSGVISVGDFYGAANLITLDFLTHGTGTNGSSISIGTARSTRMVHLSGYTTNGVFPTSVTIGGITATLLTRGGAASLTPSVGTLWQAWAKVPTGTTATVSISTAATYYIATFSTVNSGAATTGNSGTNLATTYTFTAADPGVCFWGGNGLEPSNFTPPASLSTNSPGGVTYYFTATGNAQAMAGYNITSTTVSQTFTVTLSGGKIGGAGTLASIFYAN